MFTEKIPETVEAVTPWWEILYMIVGSMSGVGVIIGFLIWLFKPHLKSLLASAQDASEAKRQLTQNGGKNIPPTILDIVGRMEKKQDENTRAIRQLDDRLTNHESASTRLVSQLVASGIRIKRGDDVQDR